MLTFMLKRLVIGLPALFLAFAILTISVLRTAAIKYEFSGPNGRGDTSVLGAKTVNIPYNLAYPGKVLPDSPLWMIKALRDKIWLTITTNPGRKAELKLLFADKRLVMSKILFEKEKFDLGYSTLTKAEKYLEEASSQEKMNRNEGEDTSEFSRVLAYASLKHRQVIEEILLIAPEDAKPKIVQIRGHSSRVYEETMHALNEKGIAVPENPFERD